MVGVKLGLTTGYRVKLEYESVVAGGDEHPDSKVLQPKGGQACSLWSCYYCYT